MLWHVRLLSNSCKRMEHWTKQITIVVSRPQLRFLNHPSLLSLTHHCLPQLHTARIPSTVLGQELPLLHNFWFRGFTEEAGKQGTSGEVPYSPRLKHARGNAPNKSGPFTNWVLLFCTCFWWISRGFKTYVAYIRGELALLGVNINTPAPVLFVVCTATCFTVVVLIRHNSGARRRPYKLSIHLGLTPQV